jgi:hypothetical protein
MPLETHGLESSQHAGAQNVARLHHCKALRHDFINTSHTQAKRRGHPSQCAYDRYPSPPRNISKCGTPICQRANVGHLALPVHSNRFMRALFLGSTQSEVPAYLTPTDASCKSLQECGADALLLVIVRKVIAMCCMISEGAR